MILANESLSKVAGMILQNLAILHISDSDARKIDKDYKLRTDMPDGWKFGDSIFDRIVFAKIKF